MTVFVLAHDGGYEGFRPVQVCPDEESARAALALLNCSGETYRAFALPMWPATQSDPWWNIDPTEFKK